MWHYKRKLIVESRLNAAHMLSWSSRLDHFDAFGYERSHMKDDQAKQNERVAEKPTSLILPEQGAQAEAKRISIRPPAPSCLRTFAEELSAPANGNRDIQPGMLTASMD